MKFKLFITAFFQVLLVAGNTYFISQRVWIGIAIASFGISFLWTYNVKKISASSTTERIIYSTGAMCGGLLGVFIAIYFTN